MSNHILSLLGLALRGGRLAVGEEPAALAAKAGQARLLLLASDAAGNTLRRAEHLAQEGHCLWLILPFSKAELGGALGRGSAAVAALTDTGLAAAVTAKLAALDSERYGELAARMDLKRRRAKERQSAPRRDPPKRDAPPQGERRRPPRPRREGEGRSSAPGDRRRPEDRREGGPRQDRPRNGERSRPPAGKAAPPQGGGLRENRPYKKGGPSGGSRTQGRKPPPPRRDKPGPKPGGRH